MTGLSYRFATIDDTELYFKWATDPLVRQNSFQQGEIVHNDHVKWFTAKLQAGVCHFYLFLNSTNMPVGQVRIDKDDEETIIGLSIDEKFRGMSLGAEMLKLAYNDYFKRQVSDTIVAYIKETNISSYKTFIKAGFSGAEKIVYNNNATFRLIKKYEKL